MGVTPSCESLNSSLLSQVEFPVAPSIPMPPPFPPLYPPLPEGDVDQSRGEGSEYESADEDKER